MKRILFTHPSAELYGSDRTLLDAVHSVRQEPERSFEALVALPRRGVLAAELERAGARVVTCELGAATRADLSPARFPRFLARARRAAREVERIVQRERIDLVHTNTSVLVGAAHGAHRSNAVHVWHVHEILDEPAWANRAMRRMILRWNDVAVTPSRATAASMLDPRVEHVAIVPNGVDPERVQRADPDRGRALIGHDGALVVLPGRINAWKGQRLFVEAARVLCESGRDHGARFVIVGSPAEGGSFHAERLDRAIEQSGLGERIQRMPFTRDLVSILAAADLCVVPSTRPEPFGLVAVEAMAVGTPVVAADHGGLAEIVRDGVTGRRFRPRDPEALADEVADLLASEELRRGMGEAARRRQRAEYTRDHYGRALLDVYHRALDTERGDVRHRAAA